MAHDGHLGQGKRSGDALRIELGDADGLGLGTAEVDLESLDAIRLEDITRRNDFQTTAAIFRVVIEELDLGIGKLMRGSLVHSVENYDVVYGPQGVKLGLPPFSEALAVISR